MSDAYMMPPAAEQDDQKPKIAKTGIPMLEQLLQKKRFYEEMLATVNTAIEILQRNPGVAKHFEDLLRAQKA